MKFTKDNLNDLAKIMDERLLKFHEEVSEPMVDNIYERLQENMSKIEDNTYRIEKKLVRLEGKVVPSL